PEKEKDPQTASSLSYKEIVERLALADYSNGVAVHEYFRRQQARVVMRSHRKAVGAGVAESEQVADCGVADSSRNGIALCIACEDVAGLAQVDGDDELLIGIRLAAGVQDVMIGAVLRRADEMVESRIAADPPQTARD